MFPSFNIPFNARNQPHNQTLPHYKPGSVNSTLAVRLGRPLRSQSHTLLIPLFQIQPSGSRNKAPLDQKSTNRRFFLFSRPEYLLNPPPFPSFPSNPLNQSLFSTGLSQCYFLLLNVILSHCMNVFVSCKTRELLGQTIKIFWSFFFTK